MSRRHHETTTAARKKYGEPLICVQKNVYRFCCGEQQERAAFVFCTGFRSPVYLLGPIPFPVDERAL